MESFGWMIVFAGKMKEVEKKKKKPCILIVADLQSLVLLFSLGIIEFKY
jgi:hypothetical protein